MAFIEVVTLIRGEIEKLVYFLLKHYTFTILIVILSLRNVRLWISREGDLEISSRN